MSYTYNPAECMNGGKDQMRFELGDTIVDSESCTAFLTDEEITSLIAAYPRKWKMAKYKLIEAVCNRLSFETNWSDDGTSFSLDQRASRWQTMLATAKRELKSCLPTSGAVNDTVNKSDDGGHYFYAGMQESQYTEGDGRGDRR